MNASYTPLEMMLSVWRNRALIGNLVKREISGRYRGSMFGVLWALLHPIFMLSVYTFVFSVVFKARWNAGSDSKTEFALLLFAGLLVFNLFSECVSRAPGLILSNANFVKKVVFPLEILPWVVMGAALFHLLLSLAVWLIAYTIFIGLPHLSVLLVPIVLIPFILLIMGLCWALASLGVYVRDIGQLVGLVITVLMFLSPIFYPASALPGLYRRLLYLNPITPAVEMLRDVLYWNRSLNSTSMIFYVLSSAVVSWLGFAWFQKTRKGFADVL